MEDNNTLKIDQNQTLQANSNSSNVLKIDGSEKEGDKTPRELKKSEITEAN